MDAIKQYLEEISQYLLLTPEEEKELMLKVIKYREATKSLKKLLSKWQEIEDRRRWPRLEREAVKLIDLCQEARKEAFPARQRLINSNQRLVIKIASAYTRRNKQLDLLDLVAWGNLGLIHAIDNKFEYGKGAEKLSTYATRWIWQGIQRNLQDHLRIVHIPTHLTSLVQDYQEAIEEIQGLTGNPHPDIEEISRKMGIDKKRAGYVKRASKECLSLNFPTKRNGDAGEGASTLEKLVEDGKEKTNGNALDCKELVRQIIKQLPAREAFIILAHFGLDCEPKTLEKLAKKARISFDAARSGNYTLEELGSVFKLTRERIRQIEKRSIKGMRPKLRRFESLIT